MILFYDSIYSQQKDDIALRMEEREEQAAIHISAAVKPTRTLIFSSHYRDFALEKVSLLGSAATAGRSSAIQLRTSQKSSEVLCFRFSTRPTI